MAQVGVAANALSLALYERGWTAVTNPGEEIVFKRDGHELIPFVELRARAEGKTSAGAWAERCTALGIGDVPLTGATAA